MKRKLMVRIFLLLLFFPFYVSADDDEIWDKLVWDYSEFTQNFEMRNWKAVDRYINDKTKAGFGGETGIEGVKQVYANDERCFDEMVLALKQGCKKSDAGGELSCDAPPQWADSSVVYLGARAGFEYSRNKRKWFVKYLICGGD